MYSNKKRLKNEAVDNYADEIVLNPNDSTAYIPKKIWMYWEGELSPFVTKCVERIKQYNPNYEVYFLGPETIRDFCNIEYLNLEQISPQQKADLIRFDLLYRYGGIWLDASIIVYDSLDWIQTLIEKNHTNSFAFYRAKNTTNAAFPVLENWLLASNPNNIFFKHWFDELVLAIQMTPKGYIQQIKNTNSNYKDIFQEIGRLEYLVAYVACQNVMRKHLTSMTLINCDKNALFYQVKNEWKKEKVLIDMAINFPPTEKPKLIKLVGKERKILSHYYSKGVYFQYSLLDL